MSSVTVQAFRLPAADFDEAWMEVRRGQAGDRQRALALLEGARGPFESIGMPGWLRRAEELRQQLESY